MTKPQLAARYNELAEKLGKPTTKRMESRERGIRRVRELEKLLAQREDGADFSDGHDHEGFKGGCERFGHTAETCPEKPKARKPKPKRPRTPAAIKQAMKPAPPPKPYVKGERTHAACAKDTWKNPKVAEARAKRYAVVVGGEQYRSVNAAFKALRLPLSKVCVFRPQLIRERVSTFDGHTFELAQGE